MIFDPEHCMYNIDIYTANLNSQHQLSVAELAQPIKVPKIPGKGITLG